MRAEADSYVLPKPPLPTQPLPPIRNFLTQAFKSSNNEHFRALQQALKSQQPPALVQALLFLLRTEFLHELRKNSALTHWVIRMTPEVQPMHLWVALVTSHAVLLKPVLHTIWVSLSNGSRRRKEEEEEDDNVQAEKARRESQQLLHCTLASVLRLVPTAASELPRILEKHPPPFDNVVEYFRTALQICDYCPAVASHIVGQLLDQARQMDVLIPYSNTNQSAIVVEDSSETATQAESLDQLIVLLLEWKGVVNDVELYDMLESSFLNSILLTHRSKFVQFSIFALCGRSSDTKLYQRFLRLCMLKALHGSIDTVTRQAAVCYAASLVSRAKFCTENDAFGTVDDLLDWALQYCKTAVVSNANARRKHALFYTVCQAAFYISCFRGVRAGSHDDRWSRLCSHALDPLCHCLESVRHEFLAVADYHDLIAKYHGAKAQTKKKRVATPISVPRGGVGGLGVGTNPLDSFFPFDPYLLHESNKYMEPYYIHWNGSIIPFEDEEEDEEEDDEDADESVETNERHAISPDDDQNEENDDGMSLSTTHSVHSAQSMEIYDDTPVHDPWLAIVKRARAPSIETGSW